VCWSLAYCDHVFVPNSLRVTPVPWTHEKSICWERNWNEGPLFLALQSALNTLGYRTYHYTEILKNRQDSHLECWTEALEAKVYGNGSRYGRAEFDRLLGSYSVRFTLIGSSCFFIGKRSFLVMDEFVWCLVQTSLFEGAFSLLACEQVESKADELIIACPKYRRWQMPPAPI
jgi:hypothetical protein